MLLANDTGDRPNFGTVVAVGEGKKDEEGKTVAPNVPVGATVMYSKYSGTEFEVRLMEASRLSRLHESVNEIPDLGTRWCAPVGFGQSKVVS